MLSAEPSASWPNALSVATQKPFSTTTSAVWAKWSFPSSACFWPSGSSNSSTNEKFSCDCENQQTKCISQVGRGVPTAPLHDMAFQKNRASGRLSPILRRGGDTAPYLFLFFLVLAGCCFAQDWPQFLGPHANGISDETGLRDKWPTNGPPLLWEKKIGTGYGAPSIRGDLLVFHHRLGDEEIVEALEAGTGKSIWHYAYPSHFIDPYGYNNGPRSSPLLTDDHCYTLGAEGKLVCLDLKTGK